LKKEFKPTNAMYPLPAVLVTTCDANGRDNIITIAWTTNISRENSCVAVSIGGNKLSLRNIRETKDFVINIPGTELLEKVDFCGENHGDDIDKFDKAKLTRQDASMVKSKLIDECPINLECKLVDIYEINSAYLVVGKIVKVHIDDSILDENEKIDYIKLNPIVYANKTYFGIREELAKRGFSKNKI